MSALTYVNAKRVEDLLASSLGMRSGEDGRMLLENTRKQLKNM